MRPERRMRDLVRRGVRRVLGGLGISAPPSVPWLVNWDLTYACPLRCEHCYSESGRRPTRQLPLAAMHRIADILLALEPVPEIVFTGGEPIIVRGFLEIADKLVRGGARLALYTSGWKLQASMAEDIVTLFHRIGVSIDGGDEQINDVIRGRRGAFAEAVRALELLDRASSGRPGGGKPPLIGIECGVVKSNLHHLESLCTEVAPRFRHLSFIHFGAIIPTGLASEAPYAERELLGHAELETLARAAPRLASLAPTWVTVRVRDNAGFKMQADQVRKGAATDHLVKIEADGRMRGMDIYEGTVGNVLEEPFDVLWRKAIDRHRDPFVEGQLVAIDSMHAWAAATRNIDRRFASGDDLIRLERRGR
jgi:MoaA/NifB/PqqE/SkfB family radical SAM enzyme